MSMSERRITQRRRISKSGTIEFLGGAVVCTVKNISEAGASLEVMPGALVPDRFTLVVHTDKLRRRCDLVWRSEDRTAVVFK